MAYQALARKYRPEQFSDLIGQEAVSLALVNAIRLGREPCGIIFSGLRGIGKTTSARIFAKALNCDKGPSPEPCSDCYSCKAIAGTYHEDVIEIDGASNNGVSEIRALQETLGYTPQRSRYKVYIIDEVHMLSNSAFNALLKTLEEPPQNVVFILATTELHKVPKTVISRCQTFYLKRVNAPAIHKRLREILVKENLPFEEEALAVIAQEANGSVRDALTLLDQVIALGGGQIKRESLKLLLTSLSNSFFIKFLDALLNKRSVDCLNLIAELNQEGVEFDSVVEDLASYLRHTMILKNLGVNANDDTLAKLSQEDKAELHALGTKVPELRHNELFHQLLACSKEMDASWLDRFVLENYCLEWCLKPDQVAQQARPNAMMPPQQQYAPPMQRAAPPVQQEIPQQKGFPGSWEEFIARCKHLSPFQGRKLEELSPLEFTDKKISVAVDPKSFFGEEILKAEAQKKFAQMFLEWFEFKGVFEVRDKNLLNSPKAAVPESIVDEKARKEAELRKKLEKEAHQHPLTQAVLSEFGGRIEKTEIHL